VLPTLIDYNGGATFLSTPRGFNHFYDLCNREGKDWEHFHFTSYDNPHLPEGAVEELLEELGKEAESQEILADFTQQQGLVYNELNREVHLKESTPFLAPKTIAGIDFGYTDPAAVLSIKTDGYRYYVEKEYYEVGRTHDEIASYVAVQNFNEIYADPASPEAIEVMRRKALPVKEVVKGKDSIVAGIMFVKQLLRENRLFIHPDCKSLIREFDMYVWSDKKANIPEDEYNHGLDALRYALYMQKHQDVNTMNKNYLLKQKNRQKPSSFV
jgi:phage terminase large subunit